MKLEAFAPLFVLFPLVSFGCAGRSDDGADDSPAATSELNGLAVSPGTYTAVQTSSMTSTQYVSLQIRADGTFDGLRSTNPASTDPAKRTTWHTTGTLRTTEISGMAELVPGRPCRAEADTTAQRRR
jgi:hypothetical protein